MSVRARRPAAAVKAAPKAKVRARAVLRRPAAVAGEEDLAIEDRFKGGGFVEADKTPPDLLIQGTPIVVEGEYWGGKCKLCGLIQGLQVKGAGDSEITLTAEGTDHEELLKWISGNPGTLVRVHLCGKACLNKVDSNGLVHGQQVRLKSREDEGGWAENLKGSLDELAQLRKDARQAGEREPEAPERREEKKQKKKKKKKVKESESSTSKDKKKAAKEENRKLKSQKDLKVVFGTTGLDPDVRVRKQVRRRVKKRLRSKKRREEESTSSNGTSEGSSGVDSLGSGDSGDIFEEAHKVRTIAKRAPGALTCSMVRGMQRQLLTASGSVWDQDTGAVPPVALQFFRNQLQGKLSGGASREALTLCWALDLGLQGKLADMMDCLSQRLKSVEMTANGGSWMVSQRVEVVPPDKPLLASRAEAQAAAKENKEEMKVRALTKGKEKGRGENPGGWRPMGKGEQKGKDKAKGKKGDREDGKKGS